MSLVHVKFIFLIAITAVFFAVSAFAAGIYDAQTARWPSATIRSYIVEVQSVVGFGGQEIDEYGRLLSYRGKIEIACPEQDSHTAVLLIIGQSNAGNHQGQRFKSRDRRIANYINGKCYLASSPLLGAEGNQGESWTLLAQKLISNGSYTSVILAPVSVGSTVVQDWSEGGYLNPVLVKAALDVAKTYKITHILWHQGEADFSALTTQENYQKNLKSMIASIRHLAIKAPIFVSVASFEERFRQWSFDNPVVRAQRSVVDNVSVLAGPDTDSSITDIDRYDGTHFSETGQEIFANEWLKIMTDLKKIPSSGHG